MSRIITSLVVVIALLVLSTAAPCLACSAPNRDNASAGSCCHHGGCEKPAKAPANPGCGAPDLGITTVEQAWAQLAHAAATVVKPVSADHAAPLQLSPVAFARLYSPPHLYLRNSILII